jgi:class 3 adenylate cyclase/tetratricopeptide (TPR) repeat protein
MSADVIDSPVGSNAASVHLVSSAAFRARVSSLTPVTCPACHRDAPDDARFCPSCGQDLRVRGDERRVVTVLFADLVGFTAMSEVRDPEHMKNLVDRCFEQFVRDIEAFGGRVDKIVGDAIVALFGAPVAHEDDAERAVRAALQLHRTLERVGGVIGVDVRMRVGVNTGEVLVGALRAGGDYTAMGDVVNIAQRLQTTAKPGQVLVGPATHAATHRVVRYEPVGELQVKGRDEAVSAWIAREAVAPPGYRPNRKRAPLVGRDAELAMLCAAIGTVASHRRAALVLLLGEAGVGKSRLAEELAEHAGADHDALVLEGRCVPYGEANVWWPVAEALREGCGIGADDPEPEARRLAQRAVKVGWPGATDVEVERIVNGLLYLMGYEGPLNKIDAPRAREEATWAVVTFAERYARQRPVVVVLSDLHWADEVVLTLVDTLLERLCRHPFVLLATARQVLEERWKPPAGGHHLVSLHLDPLGASASRELLASLSGVELDDELERVLLDRGGGNPFYLEELVALLAESGVVGVGAEAGSGAAGSPVVLPDTLRGLMAARLDSLLPRERRLVDGAAVLGRSGPVSALCVMDEVAFGFDGNIDDVLASVVAKDLLVVDGDVWSFRSDLVREVAYGTLTKAERARLHAGIASYIERHEKGRDADVDRIAHHWSSAAELVTDIGAVDGVPRDVESRALTAIEHAAARAEQVDVPLVAARLFGDALRLVGDEPSPRRHRFLLGRATALGRLREMAEARAVVTQAVEDARTLGDEHCEADALLVLADVEQKEGAYEAADSRLDQLISLFERLGDDARRAEALRLKGMGALLRQDLPNAVSSVREALELFRQLGDRRGEAWALQHLSWCAFVAGRLEEAEELLHTSATTFAELGDGGGLGWALGLLAYTRFHEGFADEAESMAEDVLVESRERGDRWGAGMMLVLTATIRLWTGRTESAASRARDAVAMFEAMGDPYAEVQARLPLGRALAALGRVDEAFEVLDAVRRYADAGMADQPRSFFLGGILGTAIHLGDVERAEALVEIVPDVPVGTSDAPVVNGERETALALLDVMRGRAVDAAERLDRLAMLPGRWSDSAYSKSARALACAASGRASDAVTLADEVLADDGASYLDRLTAGTARGLALARGGDPGALDALAAVRDEAERSEDRVARALAMLAEGIGLDALGRDGAAPLAEAADRLAALGVPADGWHTAYREAAGIAAPSAA